jgi:membrane protein YqaA with SNARE-associated domain
MGNTQTIAKWLKVKEKRIIKAKDFVNKRGSWIAIFTFLPILGTAIAVAMGMLRTNIFKVLVFTTIGKVVRYIIVAFSVVALKGAA